MRNGCRQLPWPVGCTGPCSVGVRVSEGCSEEVGKVGERDDDDEGEKGEREREEEAGETGVEC